jgi:predicted TPR repeat methyltransferase
MNRKQRRAAAKQGNAEALCALADRLVAEHKIDEAAKAYRQALAANPALAHLHNNYANLLKFVGRLDEAEAHYTTAIELEPRQAMHYTNLAHVRVEQGRIEEAIALYRQAVAFQHDQFEAHNGLGTALKMLGQADEAMAHYRLALDARPSSVDTRLRLAHTLMDQGRKIEALDEAETASRASEDPTFPHHLFGLLMARCDCRQAARLCFAAQLARDPEDRLGVRLLLAALDGGPLPERASARQLELIYAQRAKRWDDGASGPTGYRGADLVAGLVDRLAGDATGLDILDAGCGTGMVGDRVAWRARHLMGVDSSLPMLLRARDKGFYQHLHQEDLVSFLESKDQAFDIVTCAATLIHFGNLRPAFAAVAKALRPNGLFVFTLFPNPDDEEAVTVGSFDGFAEGGCFRHGRNYVRRMAGETDLTVEALELDIHEYLRGKPVMGLVGALRRIAPLPIVSAA